MTSADSSVDALRPLPARLDLEFEKERAQRMVLETNGSANLESATAIHAETWRRGEQRADAADGVAKLSEAQLRIAREYGFSSWNDLSAYYKTWERHERAGHNGWNFSRKNVDDEVARLLASANLQSSDLSTVIKDAVTKTVPLTQAQLSAIAAFVPRFYGRSNAEIRKLTLTEAEARLVVARLRRFPSWELLLQKLDEIKRRQKEWPHKGAPPGTAEALQAIRNRDGDELVRILQTHPDALSPPMLTDSLRIGPIWEIIKQFMSVGDNATRALIRKLSAAGVDVQQHLNAELFGGPFFRTSASQIRAILDLGGDPLWIPPTGASMLDYAIVRYMDGEAVDLIAERVSARKAFWVSAALGDIATMRTFINKRGQLTDDARRDRPDALALGVPSPFTRAQRPDATDLEILSEAFYYAGLNGRFNTMQELLDLGVSIDYAHGRFPLLYLAVGNELVDLAEFLVARHAEKDFMAGFHGDSVRALSERMIEDTERHPNAARIHALLSR